MFRSKLLNICSVRKQLPVALGDSFACRPMSSKRSGALLAALALLVVGWLCCGCGDVEEPSPSAIEACLAFRDSLCARYQQCLEKPTAWRAQCLAQQDADGGTCQAVLASSPCLSSRAKRISECAEALLVEPCPKLCHHSANRVTCSGQCEVICISGNSIKL